MAVMARRRQPTDTRTVPPAVGYQADNPTDFATPSPGRRDPGGPDGAAGGGPEVDLGKLVKELEAKHPRS